MAKTLEEFKTEIKNTYEENKEDDWDGYQGDGITKDSLESSLKLLEIIHKECPKYLKNLEITPCPHGTIDFDWFYSHDRQFCLSIKKDVFLYVWRYKWRACGELSYDTLGRLFYMLSYLHNEWSHRAHKNY